MSEDLPDYDDFLPAQDDLPESKADRLEELIRRQIAFEVKVARAEELLKGARQELAQVSEQQLPDLLDELNLSSFVTAGGTKVKLDTTIRASLGRTANPQGADAALDWLISNGHANLVKHNITIPLTAGRTDLLEEAMKGIAKLSEELSAQNEAWSLDFEDKRDVHPSTLSSFVSKALEKGVAIPEGLFNVHRNRKTKVTV
jgi:hypothetical protein